MTESSRVFLKLQRIPPRHTLAGWVVELHRTDLVVLRWSMDFSEVTDTDQAGELLWQALGEELLRRHRDERGVLVTPDSLCEVDAPDYDSGVLAYAPAGLWVPNVPHRPDRKGVAGDASEIPLPRYPRSHLLEFYALEAARAMRELSLPEPPLRSVRLELAAMAAPRAISDFYLPRLHDLGLHVKRRVWTKGLAEQLCGEHDALKAMVYVEQLAAGSTLIQLSWALKR
jgi:hypothetical protein